MNTATDWNEVGRITGTVSLCMLLGHLLNLGSPVYLALFPILSVTKARDYSWRGLARMFRPVLIWATAAVITVELFANHPYVVWAISLMVFDQLHARATTPMARNALVLPVFNWIMMVVFAQTLPATMPDRLHDIVLSLLITMVVMKTFAWWFPPSPAPASAPPQHKRPDYAARLRFVTLLGGGLAFLMIVDMISATFCMVPVILAATQTERGAFMAVLRDRLLAQVGGCALAMVFMLLLAGQQSLLPLFALGQTLLVFVFARQISRSSGEDKALHGDALLGIALPIQLYMGVNDFGLSSALQRGWQLSVTLFVLAALAGLIFGKIQDESVHHHHS
ncbi:DUF2955 domain-containing protein [Ferrimonas balearica]|uniref:DUF2955 domain-containing protein n=1 Tax=Ferrimonas balearica TaxID=44012 RepID=UPI001C592A03|nr:DUF2955 domain-containing protein [Ferrimonas balearica]MBW3163972.1 DUF2955 domain-containing protein [Ferrimonas balearica]